MLLNDLDTVKRVQKDAEAKLKNQTEQVGLWIKSLIDIAKRLAAQAMAMGMDGLAFSLCRLEVPSAKLGVFFNELIEKLKAYKDGRAEWFATESRELAHDVVFMVLSNIACLHPDLDLGNRFRKPPMGTDVTASKEKATCSAARVLQVEAASLDRQAK